MKSELTRLEFQDSIIKSNMRMKPETKQGVICWVMENLIGSVIFTGSLLISSSFWANPEAGGLSD